MSLEVTVDPLLKQWGANRTYPTDGIGDRLLVPAKPAWEVRHWQFDAQLPIGKNTLVAEVRWLEPVMHFALNAGGHLQASPVLGRSLALQRVRWSARLRPSFWRSTDKFMTGSS